MEDVERIARLEAQHQTFYLRLCVFCKRPVSLKEFRDDMHEVKRLLLNGRAWVLALQLPFLASGLFL
jgi:hypothetical protein